jgi:hypothetical protein
MFRLSNRVEKNANKIVQKAATAAIETLVEATPVDRGDAVSNWRAGKNYAPVGRIPAHVPGRKGSTAEANQEVSLREAQTVINARKTGDTIYLVNNVPYIGRLNSGWSSQAPAGFIERGVAAGRAVIRRGRLLEG